MDFTAVKTNLENLGYKVSCFATKEEAADYLNRSIDGTSVGIGGSRTVNELGLYELLSGHNEVYWHDRAAAEGKDVPQVRGQAAQAKVYLSSVNGLAETGEIINIDGRGNRVASTLYGHEKVYLIVGQNKIAPDYDSALFRARNVAGPKNAKRLGVKTPCAVKADKCYNCKSPERICRALVVFWENLLGADTEIVLVQEDLGF
ncbi:MAG: lactate utilization protein [Eubacterium sp.]|nr:lactate utilization protein [Eubacterium sp.]